MSTLVVELPEEHVQVLARVAHERGTSIDTVVAELVETIVVRDGVDAEYDVTRDSLYTITAHESDAPADLSRNADQYLYGAT